MLEERSTRIKIGGVLFVNRRNGAEEDGSACNLRQKRLRQHDGKTHKVEGQLQNDRLSVSDLTALMTDFEWYCIVCCCGLARARAHGNRDERQGLRSSLLLSKRNKRQEEFRAALSRTKEESRPAKSYVRHFVDTIRITRLR